MKSTRSGVTIVALLVFLVVAGPRSLGTEINQTDEQLQQNAELIVSGQVGQVYPFEDDKGGGYVDNVFLVEIKVATVEKGSGIKPGDLVFVRCRQAAKRPSGWSGADGHGFVPASESSIRAYLRRDGDGRYDPLTPNGIASQDAPLRSFSGPLPTGQSNLFWWCVPAGALLGFVGGHLTGYWLRPR
jgi:hypothetical protein